MKIAIIGAGQVGTHLAKNLSWQDHDIIVIDDDQERIDLISNQLDVLAILCSGTSASTLINGGVDKADMLIAVTSIDEVNIVACTLAKHLGVKTRIARVRNREYSQVDTPVSLYELGIDQVINPELEAAKEVVQMIKFQHATNIVECADGQVILVGIKVEPNSEVVNRPLKQLIPPGSKISFRIAAINRTGDTTSKTVIPTGNDIIRANDTVYVMTPREEISQLFKIAGKKILDASADVMLLGGGRIGRFVAEELEQDKNFNVKLIESDLELSQRAADQLVNTIVVRGREGIDIDLLALEGLSEMDVFVALSDDDESNIVTSLFARHLKVKRIITLISRPEYMAILKAIGLDAAINERVLTSDAILKYMLGGKIMAVSSIRNIDAEIIEFVVGDWSKVTDKKIKDINFPEGAMIGAIEHRHEVHIATGESTLMEGDRVVVFCLPKALPKLEKLFKEH